MDPWLWTLIFFALAFLFAFLEVFVTSGGILAFLASASLLGSIVFAFLSGPVFGGTYTLGLVLGVPVLLWYLFKWWPQSIMGRRLLLNPEDDPALQPDAELIALKKLVGRCGVAKSRMMLSGLVEIDGRRLNAVSESEPVEPGEEVVVINVDGVNVLVRKVFVQNGLVEEAVPETERVDAVEDPFA